MNNKGTRIKYNLFAGGFSSNIDISVSGEINSNQGGFTDPARNCLTSATAILSSTFGVQLPFNYFVSDLTVGAGTANCLRTPNDANEDFTLEESVVAQDDECNINNFGPGPIPPKQSLIDLRNQLVNVQNQIQANPHQEDSLKIVYTDVYRMKEDTLVALLLSKIDQKKWTDAEQLLIEEGDQRSLEWRVGLYIRSRQFSKLNQFFLNEWPKNTVDETYFEEMMKICANFYDKPSTFSLSSADELLLKNIADSNSKRKYRARALLNLLLDLDYPIDPVVEDSTKSLQNTTLIKPSSKPRGAIIYPNPVQQELQIAYGNIPFQVDFWMIRSLDNKFTIRGKISQTNIDIRQQHTGIYYITFYGITGEILTRKFIVAR